MAGIHRLSARAVATAKTPGLHADGGGLYLQVTLGADAKPRRSWALRFTSPDGRRREMGLGNAALIDLANAREDDLTDAQLIVTPHAAAVEFTSFLCTAKAHALWTGHVLDSAALHYSCKPDKFDGSKLPHRVLGPRW